MSDRVLLVDGHSLFHRAFHALPPLMTSSGQPTNALYGFLQMLLALLEEEQPGHALVALDLPGPTFRDEIYEEYKAHRPPSDDALRAQIPLLCDVIEALGMASASMPGYEADDIIGTLAHRAAQEGMKVTIVTGDRDLLQLVDDNVEVLATLRGIKDTRRYDPQTVRAEYGFEPRQLIDHKALAGDTSDNIPGVPGIGDKGAKELLAQMGSVENAIEHIDEIDNSRIRTALENNPDLALLSKRLATIETQIPLELKLEEIVWEGLPIDRLRRLATELEFTSLLDRLPRGEKEACDIHVEAVHEQARLDELVATIADEGSMALGLAADGELPVLAIATGDDRAALVALAAQEEFGGTLFANTDDDGLDLAGLKALLSDDGVHKRAADLKGMIRWLARSEICLRGAQFDPEIASYLLLPNRRDHSIGLLAQEHLGYALPEADGEAQAEVEPACLRAAAEAVTVRALHDPLRSYLDQAGLLALFDEIEMPLVPVLAEMELAGIAVDVARLEELGEGFDEMVQRLEREICELACCEFNVGSPQQVAEVLFERMQLPKGRKTKTGWSTSAAVLEELAVEHEIARLVLQYREYAKLRSTYADGLLREVDPKTGRIHTTFEQTVAATGRLSSRNPNLQNIPIRTEWGREIRSCFVSEPGKVLVAADYSQIELRILAHISGDRRLVEAFRAGADIHTETAAALFDVPAEEVDAEMRRKAKTTNFAVLYGQGPSALGKELNISKKEAAAFIENYFSALPGVRDYLAAMAAMARECGYVETLLGRKRPLPEINSSDSRAASYAERAAANTPIQGTAADIIKVAMIHLAPRLREISPHSRMLLQVHDELVVEAPEKDADVVAGLVREVMQAAYELDVPLTVDVAVGKNWRDMEEVPQV
ncbi:MAG: DNA polymerase I [candidate division WS1 bacterium]|jgi:DNA polymerase-1|nr:DNA polymerase I [candidate division WS1 bacterium]